MPRCKGHLTFALKHERLDLALLKRLFITLDSGTVERVVRARPSGIYARRTWFLYEWLTGRTLDIPDSLGRMKYVPVMDPTKYFAGKGTRSVRHRVVNNLPGTPDFCPVVARTPLLDHHAGLDLAEAAAQVVRSLPSDLLSRSAAFLLLKDSKASYSIEGEKPDRARPGDFAVGLDHAQIVIGSDSLIRHDRIRASLRPTPRSRPAGWRGLVHVRIHDRGFAPRTFPVCVGIGRVHEPVVPAHLDRLDRLRRPN